MKCSKCGNIVINQEAFCSKCGAPADSFVQEEMRPADGIELPPDGEQPIAMPPFADETVAVNPPMPNQPYMPPFADETVAVNPPMPNQPYMPPVNEQPYQYYTPPVPVYKQAPVVAPQKRKLTTKGKRMLILGIIALVLVLAILAGTVFVILPLMGVNVFNKDEADISDVNRTVDYSGLVALFDGYDYTGNIRVGFDSSSRLCVFGNSSYALEDAESGTAELLENSDDIEIVNLTQNMVNYFQSSDGDDIAEQYADHVKEIWGSSVTYLVEDFDDDGRSEYLYFIRDFAENWSSESGGFWMDSVVDDYYRGQVCIYADVDDSGILFNTFYFFDGDDADYSARYYNGTLNISLSRGSDGESIRLFCGRIEDSKENYANYDNQFRSLCQAYAQHLISEYPYRVGVKIADIADAPGKEVIFVLSDGSYSLVYANAFYYGRPIVFYNEKGERGCAVYLVKRNGKDCLMEYYQSTYNSGGIKTSYSYNFIGFDEAYGYYENGGQQIELWDNKVPTSADNEFFANLNSYLDSSTVCSDPFELTGYNSMPDVSTDFNQSQNGKYLNITNCNTNKIGRVAVNWDSWLNLRKGPSVDYDKVLLYSYDKKSFIKQMNGSSVTIIDTVNTGDKKNPIWVEIQIKYAGLTLTGYSSQSFIDIPNIKHMAVGESFTVQANTNDGRLYWSTNDSSVLAIDSSTGRATARKKGLVLVSVTTQSGLYDSCLILVD